MTTCFVGEYQIIPGLGQLKQLLPNIKAVLFDMDGTLINSEPTHARSFVQALVLNGAKLPENINQAQLVERYKGLTDTDVVEKLKEEKIIPQELSSKKLLADKHKFLLSIMTKEGIALHPRMMALLNEISHSEIKMGIVTASERQVLDAVVSALNLAQTMHIFLGREDTPKTKPSPVPYQEAMRRLMLSPKETLILEDSHTGLSAAQASGAYYLKAAWF